MAGRPRKLKWERIFKDFKRRFPSYAKYASFMPHNEMQILVTLHDTNMELLFDGLEQTVMWMRPRPGFNGIEDKAKTPKSKKRGPKGLTERNDEMWEMYKDGESINSMSRKYSISRQRVKEIMKNKMRDICKGY